jgi:hypothetical protein
MATQKKASKQIELAKPIQNKTSKSKGWYNGKTIIPFSQMNDAYLQNAFVHCWKKELFYHNRMLVFDAIREELEIEARKRGIELKEPENNFVKNNINLKEKVNG